jgi:hypothetical protein
MTDVLEELAVFIVRVMKAPQQCQSVSTRLSS